MQFALKFFLLEYFSLSVESLGDVLIFLAGSCFLDEKLFSSLLIDRSKIKKWHLSSFHESGPGRQVSGWWGPSQFERTLFYCIMFSYICSESDGDGEFFSGIRNAIRQSHSLKYTQRGMGEKLENLTARLLGLWSHHPSQLQK